MIVNETKNSINGIKSSFPIVLGYLPIGFAYGILGTKSGFSILQVVALSLFVYAGSAQFIAISLLSSGTDIITLIMTIFIVNLRHFLYSTSLSQYMKRINRKHIPILSFFITDETYAVSITDLKGNNEYNEKYFYQLFFVSYTTWVISSFIGAMFGSFLNGSVNIGLDFALPAMYIALLLMQISGYRKVFISIFSGLLSISLMYILPGNINVIVSAVIGAGIGGLIDIWTKNS
ncbi:AzlC family ABC transporter permease [Thermoanaerobacterium sp. CMT5567-10]|uniref:AzlC family ABC transporter permease n=1 Tax=Thermoanaerobacterium sp. CMT5567-10 TaxID=3061989 RepID=UPI0026E10867|nr:AzlC family ABC transporter permease [Thermoanaerobacterium sp. CMT5567-10]WKV10014.1 AzlC family ABC transporter permease [Thermoanaerobacterium sp. CMT5567-10]